MSEKKLPRHVAIIMDGNGRWAKLHKIKVAMGHRKGVETLRAVIRESSDMGIHTLSLFAFSTENFFLNPIITIFILYGYSIESKLLKKQLYLK